MTVAAGDPDLARPAPPRPGRAVPENAARVERILVGAEVAKACCGCHTGTGPS